MDAGQEKSDEYNLFASQKGNPKSEIRNPKQITNSKIQNLKNDKSIIWFLKICNLFRI